MEDPWANAWGEPSKPTVPDSSVLVSGSSTWAAPSVSAIHGDNEDDLSTSSWSVQATSHWNDDSGETSIWTNDVPSSSWIPSSSTFDRISLSSASEFPSESEGHFATLPSENVQESSSPIMHPVSLEREDETPPASPDVKPPDTPPRTLLPPTLVLDEDIDAFGTFETGEGSDHSGQWTPPRSNFNIPSAEVAALAPRWDYPASAATDATHDTIKELDEAWERARQEKETQDRYVPQELLASILRQVEELSDNLWPDTESRDQSPDGPRRTDMEDLGLSSRNSVIKRLAPDDLTLPPKQPFQKTFISKQSAEALKLTRHSPLTRLSPMAFHLSSKRLNSWEASVKAKPNITADDFAPPGWKIVETPKMEVQAAEDIKKKSSSSLLSFFGRRSTTTSFDVPIIARSASPVAASSTSSVKAGSSPRPSNDSTRPGSIPNEENGQAAASSPVFSAAAPLESGANHTKGSSVSEKPSNITAVVLDSVKREATPSPSSSAVSRFFGRFSRHKSSASRDSLSLSADDLEFLSDVPTIETKEEKNNESDALSRMIKPLPLPTALPPPLAPPPRAPPQPYRASSIVSKAEISRNKQEDFLSFFDDVPPQSTPPLPPASILAFIPTPPVKSMFSDMSASATTSSSPSHLNSPSTSQGFSDQPPRSRTSPIDQIWPSFDYPSASMSKTAQTKPVVAVMTSSSSTGPSTLPPLLPNLTSGFSLPPPPSSSSSRAISPNPSHISGSGNTISPLPPPPYTRSHTPSVPAHPALSQSTSAIINDDDDFADFLSSPAQPTNSAQLAFADFQPPAANSASNGHAASSKDIFGGFEDFEDPPRPPAKPMNFTVIPSSPPSLPFKPKNAPLPLDKATRKSSRAADHSRTLSLLESAAARGRWLGPPSPLPEALPPPSTSNGNALAMDPFEGGSTMQAQQARATAALSASSTSVLAFNGSGSHPGAWNFHPPMNPTLMEPVPSPPSHKPQTLLPSVTPNNTSLSPAPDTTRTGGLSAQDLSFFEGL